MFETEKNNPLRTCVFVLVLVASTLACSSIQDILTLPTPTPTAVPPTPTPDLAPILESVAPVAKGQGIPEAGSYNPDEVGPHNLLVLNADGSPHRWNESLPPQWKPSSLGEVELVAVIFPQTEIALDTELYSSGLVTRYRLVQDVEVREARTGNTIWKGTLKGNAPGPFPKLISENRTSIKGGPVIYPDFAEGMCQFSSQQCEYIKLEGHAHMVEAIAFFPDSQVLASGGWDNTIRLWQVPNGGLLQTWKTHTSGVTSLAISPDGQTLAVGGRDHIVTLWQVSDGTLLQTLEAHTAEVTSVAFSPDGSLLASAAWDDTVRLWRIPDGDLLHTFTEHTDTVSSVAFSPDGEILASGSLDYTVRLWKVADRSLLDTLEKHPAKVRSVAFSPDGETLASGSCLWRVSNGRLIQTLSHDFAVLSVAFSPDGQTLATGSMDREIKLWRVSDGTLLRTLRGHTDTVTSLAFSPDGAYLASGSEDHTVRVWSLE